MKSFSDDLVSIITPTYNSSSFIETTIRSIQGQSHENWELLITDDCSSDNTVSLIKEFINVDNRVKLFELDKNSGAGIARNNSIKYAEGKFIAFCDSDDQWLPNKLRAQLEFLISENLDFTYSSYYCIDEYGKRKGLVLAPSKLTYSKLLRNNYVGCLTAIYNRDNLGKLYMSEIRKRQDWTLWLKILKKIHHTKGIKEPLALYRIRPQSISRNKFSLLGITYRVYKYELNIGRMKSLFYLTRYLFYLILKKIL